MTFIRFPELMKESNRRRIEKDIQYSVERSDRIVTISDFSKREIVELLHVPEEKIDIVPLASLDIVGWDRTMERNKTDDPYILFMGNVEPRKNLVSLIRAFRILKEGHNIPHKLIICGKSGWKSEEIYHEADVSGHASRIEFTGYVNEKEKAHSMQALTSLLFRPSMKASVYHPLRP